MATSTDMVALYAEIAPAFIQFLEAEKKAIQTEMARFKEEAPTARDKNSPAIEMAEDAETSEDVTEAVFDPTAH